MRQADIESLYEAGNLHKPPRRRAEPRAERAPRTLVIGIDAVPYQVVRDLTAGIDGPFANLSGPSAILSTFPSISDTAWATLLSPLGSGTPRGYETRYFEPEKQKLRGGWNLFECDASWKDTFDWNMHGVANAALAYGMPRRSAAKELDEGLRAFAGSSAPVFSMYIMSTDGLAHLHGPNSLGEVLRMVDRGLAAFRARHPDQSFNTVLLSDHGIAGGEPLTNCWPTVRRTAVRAGFRIASGIAGDHDAAFIPYGLITNFVAYTAPRHAGELAAAVTRADGVDLAVVRVGESAWRVYASRDRALIERRERGGRIEWRYKTEYGDPLGYLPVVETLGARAGKRSPEWFDDAWWFEATTNDFYPDALHRLAASFSLTNASPSLICSCAPGFMFGSRTTEMISRMTVGRLRYSHGALHRDASLGFMMSDLPGWDAPAMVRAEDALTGLVAAPNSE
jgi:hypothetical protein